MRYMPRFGGTAPGGPQLEESVGLRVDPDDLAEKTFVFPAGNRSTIHRLSSLEPSLCTEYTIRAPCLTS